MGGRKLGTFLSDGYPMTNRVQSGAVCPVLSDEMKRFLDNFLLILLPVGESPSPSGYDTGNSGSSSSKYYIQSNFFQ